MKFNSEKDSCVHYPDQKFVTPVTTKGFFTVLALLSENTSQKQMSDQLFRKPRDTSAEIAQLFE